jgi:hypothetical protein
MKLEIVPDRTAYRPGEEIKGVVSWESPKDVRSAELRLFWFTSGKGTRDAETTQTVGFELPQPSDRRSFSFTAPDFPPSFSGRLVSVGWGLELVIKPGQSHATDLVIAPDAVELSLDHPEWLQVPEKARGAIRFGS